MRSVASRLIEDGGGNQSRLGPARDRGFNEIMLHPAPGFGWGAGQNSSPVKLKSKDLGAFP